MPYQGGAGVRRLLLNQIYPRGLEAKFQQALLSSLSGNGVEEADDHTMTGEYFLCLQCGPLLEGHVQHNRTWCTWYWLSGRETSQPLQNAAPVSDVISHPWDHAIKSI